jgi:putative ABC transport system ATP-binding protein
LLADEPTGALDSTTSFEVMKLLQQINDEGITVIIVTHENDIAEKTQRIIRLKDGRIITKAEAHV